METKTKRFYLRGNSITDEQIKWLFDQLMAEVEKEKKEEKETEPIPKAKRGGRRKRGGSAPRERPLRS